MNSAAQNPRSYPHWLIQAGLWLLLTSVFGSQLYFAGYVTPWQNAFASEALYWLSWWILSPLVFWWCERLRNSDWRLRALALLLGALVTLILAPLVSLLLKVGLSWLHLCIGNCEPAVVSSSAQWLLQTVRSSP